MKKFLATLLAIVSVLALSACGKDDGLTMWCIATKSDSNRHSYEAAIADMQKKYPDTKLNWEAYENNAYKEKIKAAVSGNNMPDIFFTWSCAFLGDFVKEDKVYCLDEVYAEFKDKLPEKMCKNTTYNGKKYGVPLTMNIVGLFANMDILKEVGYDDVPKTFEDLMTCCEKIKAAGKIPFGCAGKPDDTWCVTEYLESIIEKSVGAKTLDDIFMNGQTWDNQDVAKAVDLFQDMIKKGYFDPNGISLGNDEVKQNFMDGKYAFYMNGTWNCADFAKKEGLNVKVAEFPVINADKAELGQLIGGPSDTLAVAKSAKNAKETAKYTFELGQLICKYGYLDGCGLPAWTVDYDVSKINALTQSVAKIVTDSNYMVLFGDTAMPAAEAGKYLEQVKGVYGCTVDGATFIANLKKDIR
ncbi:MAG: extracellular solute-binding protein [Lachnospiraceae bacterium]|nr:extracellular solute-binding protein [Lachnospiraceae bacterium]